MAMAQGSKLVKWLDVPGGPVASGQAVFVTGHLGALGCRAARWRLSVPGFPVPGWERTAGRER
jgi:hypothetical protein